MSDALGQGRTVLVTGGSGHLGSWVIFTLLRQGFRVRTTIRNLGRESEILAMTRSQIDSEDHLAFFAANLLSDEGWGLAVDGCDYVMHVASPMPVGEYRKQDLVTPARDGTRRVLEAAAKAGVRRVVLTSSTAAALPPTGEGGRIDETRWTERPAKAIYQYPRAKTLAERDAWNFVREGGGTMELVTVLPAMIQGPVMGSHPSSGGVVGMMLRGKIPAAPRIGFNIVDVRDLADLHLRAMLSPAAAGERFVAGGDFLWFSDIAAILREHFGPKAAKAPKRVIPDWVVRTAALFSPEMAQIAPDLGLRRMVDASKAERMLEWKTRPAANSIVDAANSIIEGGLV